MHLPEETFQIIASLTNRAKIEMARKDYPRALEFFQKAEHSFPQPADNYTGACFLFYSTGELLLQMQRTDEALGYFTRAAACADELTDAKIYYQLGLIHLHNGNTTEAKQQLLKAYGMGGETLFTSKADSDVDFFSKHIFQTA